MFLGDCSGAGYRSEAVNARQALAGTLSVVPSGVGGVAHEDGAVVGGCLYAGSAVRTLKNWTSASPCVCRPFH